MSLRRSPDSLAGERVRAIDGKEGRRKDGEEGQRIGKKANTSVLDPPHKL